MSHRCVDIKIPLFAKCLWILPSKTFLGVFQSTKLSSVPVAPRWHLILIKKAQVPKKISLAIEASSSSEYKPTPHISSQMMGHHFFPAFQFYPFVPTVSLSRSPWRKGTDISCSLHYFFDRQAVSTLVTSLTFWLDRPVNSRSIQPHYNKAISSVKMVKRDGSMGMGYTNSISCTVAKLNWFFFYF